MSDPYRHLSDDPEYQRETERRINEYGIGPLPGSPSEEDIRPISPGQDSGKVGRSEHLSVAEATVFIITIICITIVTVIAILR